jgi:hypothetical protein
MNIVKTIVKILSLIISFIYIISVILVGVCLIAYNLWLYNPILPIIVLLALFVVFYKLNK